MSAAADVERWAPDWKGQWMLALASSGNREWPWTDAADPETVFRETYPSVYARFEPLRDRLIKRTDQGVHWWELRSCDYYDLFDAPKISYQEIQFHPQYALDTDGLYGNNKVHFLPTGDRYLLGVLNSPLMWWYAWRTLPHMKDDALSPARYLMKAMPIAEPSVETRGTVESHVTDLVRLTAERRQQAAELLDWLRIEHGVATPGRKLESFWTLDDATFAREVKKRSGHSKLSPALLREIRDAFAEATGRLAVIEGSVLAHERAVSEAVLDAYGLTPDERALVWKTAPPRMPPRRPPSDRWLTRNRSPSRRRSWSTSRPGAAVRSAASTRLAPSTSTTSSLGRRTGRTSPATLSSPARTATPASTAEPSPRRRSGASRRLREPSSTGCRGRRRLRRRATSSPSAATRTTASSPAATSTSTDTPS